MTETQSDAPLELAPGSVVVIRDEEWFVRTAEDTSDGLLVHVRGLGELVRDTTASFYANLDRIEPLDPAAARVVADDSRQYRKARLWLESTFRKTAVPLGDRSLTVSTQALADPLSYQQATVRKALDPANLRPRILLADAVGLGKTLEIGMILSELVRRGRGERILVVTPRHVLEQMQQELWSRFALPFVRLDSAGIQRVRQKLPANRNPFTYFRRAIISIDTLKSDRYVASLRKQRWDAVVIDESHNLSNTATLNNRLARLLSRNAEALILASATPHNGRKESFAELIRLLDPSAIPPDGELVADEIRRLVIRRHRHSPEVAGVVGADWAERREPENVAVPASPAEDAIAYELEDVWLWPPDKRNPYSGQNSSLFPWTLAKAFLSSPAALAETITQRLGRLKSGTAAEQTERSALLRLRELTDAASEAGSAKYACLVERLKDMGVGKGSPMRAVVFAERVATLTWLRKNLPADLGLPPGAVEIMHGGLPDDEQQRIVDAFKQEQTPVRVLVTGDVASEGVNLHAQCHELIHFDIPWSLIRLEQRNGRIDRYGQKHPPRITALLLEPSSPKFAGDIRILAKLVEKENEAHTALGDVASLMGRFDVKGEEEEIRAVLGGQKSLDDVVRTVDDVRAGDDLSALFFGLAGEADEADEADDDESRVAASTGSGLYADDVAYLEEALHAAFIDPTATVSNNGVCWRRDAAFGTAELTPPPDLVQRLEVLPQSYLAERRVTDKLVLATTVARGKERLAEALRDENGSSWPDAHYLSPLHPVLDWASDRALAGLGRNEVFAVRGEVDDPTVLLLGTLTNRRGQVVSAMWLTVAFPALDDKAFTLVEVHESAGDALAALGWDAPRANPGAIGGAAALQELIAPAVSKARGQMRETFAAAEKDVAQRVEEWSRRLAQWTHEAGALLQRSDFKQRRVGVEQEQAMVEEMRPDRQLVRPLLVVVPAAGEWA
ncbi:helicase-related protein [Spirilliplanes yamanashiensis]|uniref:Helicase n=1 Tax=Spirilliplanes yamanashiensis TaxID=42233 RepID=A0A8J3Y885_9ACTN|nr:helicase-related protein [Spirilliplanes yamanashiensis]MDP9817202.1 superfamily II DNA or RNA helicase [Spirilliplanes yamanashiensis]GIJ03144.1 helicase [Spirilliplanes yamanashiensis]